ncbi:conjugal transfer protein TraR [Escherichia coli]|nr:conjugal transfer protein TraR [Escherichia coli]
MSRFRAMAARLCAAFIYVQLCLVAWRDRLIRLLLLLPVILLPHTAMANTLFDMIKTVGDGAKGSSSSFVTIAQVIGLVLFIAGLLGLKQIGKKPGAGVACILSIVVGACLAVVPEMMSSGQKTLGLSPVSIS